MELILLSGNSKKNEAWIMEVEKNLKDLFDSTYVQHYKHWKKNNPIIDLNFELTVLSDYLKDKKDYIIFAKSIGSVLTMRAITEKKINPKACMFTGVPVLWCKENNIPIDKWITNYSTPTYFIQNSSDPVIGANDFRKKLDEYNVKNYKFIELPGDTHEYTDFEKVKELVKELVKIN